MQKWGTIPVNDFNFKTVDKVYFIVERELADDELFMSEYRRVTLRKKIYLSNAAARSAIKSLENKFEKDEYGRLVGTHGTVDFFVYEAAVLLADHLTRNTWYRSDERIELGETFYDHNVEEEDEQVSVSASAPK